MATEAFRIPIKFDIDASTQRQLDSLKVSVGGGRRGGGAASSAAGTVGLAGIVGGAGGKAGLGAALGIGTLIAAVLQIVRQFKAMTSLVGAVIKMMVELLRPIEIVIVTLLLPILQILRPILNVVRQIMQPFRQLALSLARQAGQALREGDNEAFAGLTILSVQAGLLGIQAVILGLLQPLLESVIDLQANVLSGVIGAIGELFRPILEFFGVNVDNAVLFAQTKITEGAELAKDALGVGIATVLTTQAASIAAGAARLNVDVSKEYEGINDMLRKNFIGDDNSFLGKFNLLTEALTGLINPGGKLDQSLRDIVTRFQTAAKDIDDISIRGRDSGGGSLIVNLFNSGGKINRSGAGGGTITGPV